MVYCNYVGAAHDPNHPMFVGRSAVVGPDGVDVVRAAGPEISYRADIPRAQVLTTTISPAAYCADIQRNDYLNERRPDAYLELADSSLPMSLSASAASMIVSVAQTTEVDANLEAAECIEAVARDAAKAKAQGAHLILFPELNLTGYSIGKKALEKKAETKDGELIRRVRAIARELSIAIIVGYPELSIEQETTQSERKI